MSVGAVNKQTGERIPTAGMPAIDSVLSGTSTNPVQNRVVKAALDDKQDKYDTITYAEWQAMTPEQQAAKDYYISDYPSSVLTAGNISYDNTSSGMAANKVQGAIDELKSGLINVTTWHDEGIFNDSKTISSSFEQLKIYETNETGGTVFSELTVLGEWVPQAIALNNVIITRSGSTYTITANPDNRYIRILSNRVG